MAAPPAAWVGHPLSGPFSLAIDEPDSSPSGKPVRRARRCEEMSTIHRTPGRPELLLFALDPLQHPLTGYGISSLRRMRSFSAPMDGRARRGPGERYEAFERAPAPETRVRPAFSRLMRLATSRGHPVFRAIVIPQLRYWRDHPWRVQADGAGAARPWVSSTNTIFASHRGSHGHVTRRMVSLEKSGGRSAGRAARSKISRECAPYHHAHGLSTATSMLPSTVSSVRVSLSASAPPRAMVSGSSSIAPTRR